jgi:phytoene dehydrogenase-like protein
VSRSDAIVVGAGHNGLIAAILLAKAGWSVTVLEREDAPGGAIRTAEVTLPGFKHDLYATNLNLFMGSRFFAEHGDELAQHGFAVAGASKPFGSLFPDGFLGVSTDPAETLAAIPPEDARAWQELGAWFGKTLPAMLAVLGSPLPSAAAAKALWNERRVVRQEWAELARLVLQSPREFAEDHFTHRQTQALVSAWGMHLDFSPEIPGGAVFPLLETFASAQNGIALGRGGACTMVDALVGMLRAAGGQLRTGAEVTRVTGNGVELADGTKLDASRAVIANVVAPVLFDKLVPHDAVPSEFRRKLARYRFAPGTMMVHLALSELPRWSAGDHLREWCYVHLGPYLEDMSLAYTQAVAGRLPERPTLVIGQPTAIDPTRAPEGKHILWVQVRMLPAAIDWEAEKEPYADRVIEILEEYAPGLRIEARHVMSPLDLERANPNLVGGDQLAGSHHPSQNFLLRPVPGWSRYRTPVDNLYMCGAGTWPGAGVGGGSGYMLGSELANAGRKRILRSPRKM